MSEYDLMTVRQMIDNSFGEIDSSCPVNFNMLGSVLFILARRMQLLKRNFKVQVLLARSKKEAQNTRFKLTEIKIHAKKVKKKGRGRNTNTSTKVYQLLTDDLFTVHNKPTGRNKCSARKRSRQSSSGMSSDDSSPRKSTAHRRPSNKYTSARRATRQSERHKDDDGYNNDVYPAARRKSGKYFDEMSPTGRRRAGKYADDMSPTERRKAGKYTDEMSPTERRKSGRYLDDMSPTQRQKSRKYSYEISPDERKKYSGKMSERRTGGKYSDQRSTSEKSGSGKYYSLHDEFSNESVIRGRPRSNKHGAQRGKPDYDLYSQKDTSGRSKETGSYGRKIRGHDARHVDDYDDDMEEQHEKIYVVTRTPSGREIREPAVLHPVVTQNQFDNLLNKVRSLRKKLDNKTSNITSDLSGTNLITNPKAALNMSVRLEAAEAKVKYMFDVLKQIARHVPGLDVQGFIDEQSLHPDTRRGPVSKTPGDEYFEPLENEFDLDEPEPIKPKDRVTHGNFKEESTRLHDNILRNGRHAIEAAGLNNCLSFTSMEVQVAQMKNKFKDIIKLDIAIEEFGSKVVAIDEHLSFEMTSIQDSLMQMQFDLEMALEKMNDDLLAPQEDAAAVAQITVEFNEYTKDLNRIEGIQMEFMGELEGYSQDLKMVGEKIKPLRTDKCTRDQMFEALDGKLSLKDINSMLIEDQFVAVNAEMKGVFQHLYRAIFTKECEWQRTINEVKEKYYDCADTNQIVTLNESIQKEFTKMDKYMNDMSEILGPLKKYPTDKKIELRDNCLSCGAPDEIKKNKLRVKVRQQMKATDVVKLRAKEIAELCVPGQPIPHPLEQDSYVCQHDCGDMVETKEVFDLYIRELKSPKNEGEND